METYLCKLGYYNEYSEENYTGYFTVGAESYAEAVARIEERFHHNVLDLDIRVLPYCDGFTFMGEEGYNNLFIDNFCDDDKDETFYRTTEIAN